MRGSLPVCPSARRRGREGWLADAGGFLDPGGAATQGAQVVEAGAAYLAAADDFYLIESGGEALEGALHANTAGDLTHREVGRRAAVADPDHVALEDLDALSVTLNDLGADTH